MHIQGSNQAARDAIRNTQDCEAICVQTAQYCLEVGGAHADASHLRLMQNCADICGVTAKVLLRGSPSHEELLDACASICDLCAASCEMFVGDAQLKACANQCRLCALACRLMISSGAGARERGLRGARVQGGGF